MTDKSIDAQLLSDFHALAKPQQLNVLSYLKDLLKKDHSPNKGLLKLAGSISPEDLILMEQTIKEDCERIDNDSWS